MLLLASGLSASAAELKYSLTASADNFQLGSAFADVGDLDGDGTRELAIADRAYVSDGNFNSGIVYVVSGGDGGILRTFEDAPTANQLFGGALVALDADGDAFPDLAVGAPGRAGGAGSVFIFSGADGSLISLVEGPAASQYGSSLANAGDQDGDGLDELYVGAPNAEGFLGAVFVQSSRDRNALRSVVSDAPTSGFGAQIVAIGDIDDDGLADLAVSAPGFRVEGNFAGRISLIRSSDSHTAAEMVGTLSYNRLGESLAPAADADDDGFPDLLIGSYSGGTAVLASGRDLTLIQDLSIGDLPLFQPVVVGGSVDIDADGTADWLIGSPGLDSSGPQALGGVRGLSGTDQSVLFEQVATAPYSGLGTSLKALPGFGFAIGETGLADSVSGGRGRAQVWSVPEYIPPVEVEDLDGDGVPDDDDQVPDSIMDATIVLDGIDTGVENRLNENGVTLADRLARFGSPDQYLHPYIYKQRISFATRWMVARELISRQEGKQIRRAAREAIKPYLRQRKKSPQ